MFVCDVSLGIMMFLPYHPLLSIFVAAHTILIMFLFKVMTGLINLDSMIV